MFVIPKPRKLTPKLTTGEIKRYVERENVLDKAEPIMLGYGACLWRK